MFTEKTPVFKKPVLEKGYFGGNKEDYTISVRLVEIAGGGKNNFLQLITIIITRFIASKKKKLVAVDVLTNKTEHAAIIHRRQIMLKTRMMFKMI